MFILGDTKHVYGKTLIYFNKYSKDPGLYQQLFQYFHSLSHPHIEMTQLYQALK